MTANDTACSSLSAVGGKKRHLGCVFFLSPVSSLALAATSVAVSTFVPAGEEKQEEVAASTVALAETFAQHGATTQAQRF